MVSITWCQDSSTEVTGCTDSGERGGSCTGGGRVGGEVSVLPSGRTMYGMWAPLLVVEQVCSVLPPPPPAHPAVAGPITTRTPGCRTLSSPWWPAPCHPVTRWWLPCQGRPGGCRLPARGCMRGCRVCGAGAGRYGGSVLCCLVSVTGGLLLCYSNPCMSQYSKPRPRSHHPLSSGVPSARGTQGPDGSPRLRRLECAGQCGVHCTNVI